MVAVANLVWETSISTGTGNLSISAVAKRFSDAFGTGGTDAFPYFIVNRAAAEWEYGTGHMSDASTLVRDTVIESSNSNAAVNFSAGVKDITNDVPAALQATLDDLASTANGKGASLIGIEDAGGLFTATNVEAALAENRTVFSEEASALFFDQRMSTLMLAEYTEQPIFLGPDGSAIHDPFDTLDYVDTLDAVNLDTSEVGVLKPSATAGAEINRTSGTAFGDLSSFGGYAAAFDGVTSQAASSCAATAGSVSNAYIGKTLAAPAAISHVLVYGSNNQGFVGGGISPSVTITIYGKVGSAPSSGTDGTPIGSLTFTDAGSEAAGRQIDSTDLATEWDHVWVYISHDGAVQAVNCAELKLFEAGSVENVEVASQPITTTGPPAWVRVIALFEDATAVLGTDILFDVSRDGGTTWTECTLSEPFNQPNDMRVLDGGEVDVTAQPSGSDIAWRFRTANNKLVKLHAAAMWAGA